nr:hypothetical protein [Tanacetum cinerariifolium]
MTEKKVVTKLINYDILNKLSTDFETRFMSQTESSVEQAFWSQYLVQTDEPNLCGTTTVEVPKELPKVSMVNSCLKKLKSHLANFDMVVKERTTSTAITEGTWGFEHTKACFRDDIIPFVKSLKELFTSFDQCLIDEVTEVQNVFTQMELAVEQHCEEKSKVQTKMENVLQENDRLLTQALCNAPLRKEDCLIDEVTEVQNVTLEINNQLNTELFQRDTWSSQESAPTFAELFEINNLKAQAQAKDTVILKLKEKLNSLNGDVKDRDEKQNVEDSETLNIELGHQVTKLATENNHLKQTYKQLYDSIKSSRVRSKEQYDDLIKKKVLVITALKEQLDKLKGKAVITEAVSLNLIDPKLLKADVTPVVPKLRVNLASSASGSMSQDNTKNNRIRQTQNKKSKSVKTPVIRKIWKTTGKVFKTVGYIWKPTGRTFTLVGNVSPLTRITTPTIVPPREPISIVNKTDKPVVTLVYSRKPKSKNVSNKMEPNNSWGSSSSNVPSSLSACRLSKSSSGTWTSAAQSI